MHKTYLNEVELEVIEGADKIVEKIGGFPSMENGRLTSYSVKNLETVLIDVELIFDLKGWIHTLDFHYTYDYKGDKNYYHKEFNERHIKMTFRKCHRIETEGYGLGGDIYFGGPEQCDLRRRHRDKLPGHAIIIERPFCCFYTAHNEIAIFFDENECEISAELFE